MKKILLITLCGLFACALSAQDVVDKKMFWNYPVNPQSKEWKNLKSTEEQFEAYNIPLEDCKETEQIIEQYQIEKYQLNPVYTGDNIGFFEENVFLTKEDILFTSMSIKDIFPKQAINMHDFGKINIMPNGDVYANLNHPLLGNIYANNIHEILHKEVEEGKSWLRVRNQVPCNTCIYQWICPSPSDYEIAIGYPNLCHVK